jgi:hypothetical protein
MPSPDGSGNPFCFLLKQKDCSGQRCFDWLRMTHFDWLRMNFDKLSVTVDYMLLRIY